jgi:hypothetical protein
MHEGLVLCCGYTLEKAGLNQNAEIENDVLIRKKEGFNTSKYISQWKLN